MNTNRWVPRRRRFRSLAGTIGLLLVIAGVGLPFIVVAAADSAKPAAKPAATIETGANKPLIARQMFPADDPWNADISKEPVDLNSAALIASIGPNKRLHPDFGTVYDGH